MNWAAWVTGSKTITNSAGSVSDSSAFSPGGSSTASYVLGPEFTIALEDLSAEDRAFVEEYEKRRWRPPFPLKP